MQVAIAMTMFFHTVTSKLILKTVINEKINMVKNIPITKLAENLIVSLLIHITPV